MCSPRLASLLLVLAATGLRADLSTWTNLDGLSIQAEFLGRHGDYVHLRKEDGSKYIYPYAKLTTEDRARVDALAPLAPKAAATQPAVPAPETPAATVAPAGKLSSALIGKLVELKGSSFAPAARDRLAASRYLAVYYSAHWCPPCRGFTPELVQSYQKIKAAHPEFEVIFVSSDNDKKAMQGYMKEYEMDFPALDFAAKKNTSALRRPEHERGIPNLVFMDADGKELSVSYTPDGNYRGPRAVLKDIKKHFKL